MTIPRTMTAWRQARYGGPEVVRSVEVPLPALDAGDVLLRVEAVGLNAGDARLMRGTPLLVRLFFGLRRPRVAGRGMDVAGVVVATAGDVSTLVVGDRVVGELRGGGLAQYVAGPASRLVRRPDAVDAVDAACLPIAGGTAMQALALARVGSGARVLVLGAGSGVGTFTVQLATGRGAEVWATCGARAMSLVGELGAVRTFDYRRTPVEDLPPASFDAVIDIAGTASLRALRALLRAGGTAVLVAGTGSRVLGPVGRIVRALFVSRRRARLRPLTASATPAMTRDLLDLVAARRIRVPVQRTWPLEDTRAALSHIDAGHTVGKIAVRVASPTGPGRPPG